MLMQQQTMNLQGSNKKPLFHLQSKPTCYFSTQTQILIPLLNFTLSIFDIQKSTFTYFNEKLAQKRINCVKQKNGILISGSNDCMVRLWDRKSGKLIHKFNKPGAQFNCLDLTQNILTAAHTSKLVFWDIRKMKQRSQFNDSFNGEITSVQFDENIPTSLMGCSVDGMINKFDLNQADQQQSLLWCHKTLQSPSHLHCVSNMSLIQTTNHSLILLQQQDIKTKIICSDYQQPKHILHSKLIYRKNQYLIEYFRWNLQRQIVEKFRNNQVIGYVQAVQDSQIFLPINKANVFFVDEQGHAFLKHITKELQTQNKEKSREKYQDKSQKWDRVQSIQSINKNGYIMNKPSSFKDKNKKFKPY